MFRNTKKTLKIFNIKFTEVSKTKYNLTLFSIKCVHSLMYYNFHSFRQTCFKFFKEIFRHNFPHLRSSVLKFVCICCFFHVFPVKNVDSSVNKIHILIPHLRCPVTVCYNKVSSFLFIAFSQ